MGYNDTPTIPKPSGVDEIARLAQRASLPGVLPIKDRRNSKDATLGIRTDVKGEGVIFSVKKLLDEWLDQPERREGTATVDTLASFCELVGRHKDGNSALFAGERLGVGGPALAAVIDYNEVVGTAAGKEVNPARFGKHRVLYPFPLSDQCRAWKGKDGQAMAPSEFAEFIEENIADLASSSKEDDAVIRLFQTKAATPAELMLLSRDFRVKVETTITDVRVLQSGEAEIGYSEEHKAGTPGAKGKFIVPGAFVIAIPLFQDDEPVRIVSRLRYRVREGKIVWFFKLYKFADAMRDRVKECAEHASEVTKLPIFFGNPEA